LLGLARRDLKVGPACCVGSAVQLGLHRSWAILDAGPPDIGDHRGIVGREYFERAGSELGVLVAHKEHAPQPVEERRGVPLFRLDVDSLVAVDRVHQRWQVKLREVGSGEAGISVGRPLHRRADAIAVAEVDVVTHKQLVAVIEDRAARQDRSSP